MVFTKALALGLLNNIEQKTVIKVLAPQFPDIDVSTLQYLCNTLKIDSSSAIDVL
jgi:hypothetical protein